MWLTVALAITCEEAQIKAEKRALVELNKRKEEMTPLEFATCQRGVTEERRHKEICVAIRQSGRNVKPEDSYKSARSDNSIDTGVSSVIAASVT